MMKKFYDIRKENYQTKRANNLAEAGVDIMDWKKNPYTFLKSVFYIEISSLLVFVLVRTRIRPNSVTLAYAFCGIIGAVLLAIPNNITIILGLVIFFSKGILDWSDGILAKITNRSTIEGIVLDTWGAIINSLGFQVGLGLYVAMLSGNIIYFYLVIVLLALRAGDIRTCAYQHFATQLINNPLQHKVGSEAKVPVNALLAGLGKNRTIKRLAHLFRSFLDDRARSVDFIILLILIEIFVPGFFVTWLVVWALTIKYTITFFGSIFLAVKRGWIKNTKNALYAK